MYWFAEDISISRLVIVHGFGMQTMQLFVWRDSTIRVLALNVHSCVISFIWHKLRGPPAHVSVCFYCHSKAQMNAVVCIQTPLILGEPQARAYFL